MSLQAYQSSIPIPGYTLIERIGAGGYGEVWKADAPGGLVKAVKLVYGHLDEDRATRELKALNRIKEVRHPFLLSLERIEVIDGRLIIVTELADASVKDRFEECREAGMDGIPREELLVYLSDAADALDFMRERFSLQHLDVKPENLLLLGDRVKVADFGLVKQLEDVTASLVGGLTPLYAPPECFDGAPCFFSDQYSLAIVFQEMLTGILPFPGSTAAQLAAQHLNSPPRLSPLSASDQDVIGRALEKDPQRRFASCRKMVDALTQKAAAPSHVVAANDGGPEGDAMAKTSEMEAQSQQKPKLQQAARRRRQVTARSSALLPKVNAPPPMENAGRIQLDEVDARLRPTLLIGIGGTGSRVLSHFRRRLHDRYGSAEVPSLQMLLLDTDTKALNRTASGGEAGFDASQLLPVPLRKPQDYRNRSKKLLQSISRRWLYNIPRSLQTEGLRPLGRLAFLDHSQELLEQLNEKLAAMTDEASIAASSAAAETGFRLDAARVVVVASISGGSGSGMVLDVAFSASQVLADLGIEGADVSGVLMHSTSRNPMVRDLNVVNAYACLAELQHYNRHGGPRSPVFDDTYVVHLGDELSDGAYDSATASVAEYLSLDCTTACSGLLARTRWAGRSDLRTFGVLPIGRMSEDATSATADQLSAAVVQSWQAENDSAASDIERQAGEQAARAGLDFDALNKRIHTLSENALAATFDGCLQHPSAAQSVASLDRALGVVADETALNQSTPACLIQLAANVAKDAKALGQTMSQWILELVNSSPTGLANAKLAQAWLDNLVRALKDRAIETGRHLDQQLAQVARSFVEAAGEKQKKPKAAPVASVSIQQYAALRLQAVANQQVVEFTQPMLAQLNSTNDQLHELDREITFLASQFDTETAEEDDSDDGGQDVLEQMDQRITYSVLKRLPQLASDMGHTFREEFLDDLGGVRSLIEAGPDQRAKIPDALRATARKFVTEAMKSGDLAEVIFADEPKRVVERFTALRDAALPKLNAGGAKRLILVLPENSTHEVFEEVFRHEFGEPATVVTESSQAALLYEVDQVSLPHAAVSIIDGRPDYAEVAARLYTRSDINWDPWSGL